jgi:hypothetical protein
MMKAGVLLDMVGAAVITALVLTLAPQVFGAYVPG